ncbi:MAG: SAM-dependent methyltransferase [Streptosporangiaceae bacterium]|nr:SAM-dependent methyltransferase [Streptosporangiaceae bacterium]MBV9858007.1 SAM-dependent methyltransferase [Streptosporangiaceae bacterium]
MTDADEVRVPGGQPDTHVPPSIDTTRPHPARIYDYFLGGKDNFAADRETAAKVLESWGAVRTAARENRAFLGRTVRYLVAEAGVTQFLDIGAGLPSADNVHEVAQALNPESHVVYVDNDPIVLAHARALLASDPRGACAYLDADMREPEKILADPATRSTLDFGKPIALMLVALLHFIPDEDEPRRALRTLIDALPSGSYVTASHATDEHNPEGLEGTGRAYHEARVRGALRTSAEFADLVFPGLELVDPGVVLVSEWRPDAADGLRPLPSEVNIYGAVGRKP